MRKKTQKSKNTNFKVGQTVTYDGKVYLFDCYVENNRYARILLLEDDKVDLFSSAGQLVGHVVPVEELDKYER